ncbi:MAG: efflux RND transporter periplasmic adaptor subunit [Candidatus Omnitrophica bacterium]|nr:efflux RND transporter periplasmic adaptor subunit [Candidatus Omnitrophota bacterium]
MKVNLKERFTQIKIIIIEKVRDPELRKKVLSRNFLIPFIAGLILFFFIFSFTKDHVSCVGGFPVYKKSKKEPAKKEVEAIPLPVKVYKVARVSFRDTLPALGTIRGFREFDLKFPVSGVVEYINFKEGEQITQGDIIASLDQKESLLKLEYAKIEMEKQAKLYEIGSIIEAKLRQAQLEYQSAKAELDKTNLIAISDGYIGSIDMDRGAFVSPQDKMGTFVDLKDVYIEFGIIEKDVAKVREGQNIEMTVDSYPDQVFKGEVDSISPIVEGKSRTVRVRSKIANVDEKIKPGMFGRVNVLVYEKDEALVIPSSSFKKKDDQYLVYLVHSEESAQEPEPVYGTLEARSIEVQYATPDAIEVKEGLDEGDLVVVDVEQDLEDKARVEITETQEGIF